MRIRVAPASQEMQLAEPTTDRTTLELASELKTAEVIERTAERFALEAGFDEDDASRVSLACREAAVNAVLHGNNSDPKKTVTATFGWKDNTLTILIRDQGAGFDPNTVADPLSPENLLRPSGRGVFLLHALMDEVHFRQLDPGTEVKLIRHKTLREVSK